MKHNPELSRKVQLEMEQLAANIRTINTRLCAIQKAIRVLSSIISLNTDQNRELNNEEDALHAVASDYQNILWKANYVMQYGGRWTFDPDIAKAQDGH